MFCSSCSFCFVWCLVISLILLLEFLSVCLSGRVSLSAVEFLCFVLLVVFASFGV